MDSVAVETNIEIRSVLTAALNQKDDFADQPLCVRADSRLKVSQFSHNMRCLQPIEGCVSVRVQGCEPRILGLIKSNHGPVEILSWSRDLGNSCPVLVFEANRVTHRELI
jgi:hypothetical protein